MIRVVVVIIFDSYYCLFFFQITNIIGIQFDRMKGGTSLFNFKVGVEKCQSSDTSAWIVNIIVIIAFIPILNHIVIPLLREFTPNMLKRMGIGYIAAVITPLMLAVVNGVGHHLLVKQHHSNSSLSSLSDAISPNDNSSAYCMFTDSGVVVPISSWVIILPHLTITITEIFVNISSKFYCLQTSLQYIVRRFD